MRKNHPRESGEKEIPAKVAITHTKPNWARLENPPSSVYANQVELHISNWDFRFRFGETIDQQDEGANVIERARIIMSPQHTKAFLTLLADNVRKYEAAFGEIRISPVAKPQTQ